MLDEFIQELKDEFTVMSKKYHIDKSPSTLDKMREIKKEISDNSIVNKACAGNTMSIIALYNQDRLQHKLAPAGMPELSAEELAIKKLFEEAHNPTRTYKCSQDVLDAVLGGWITPVKGKEFMTLFNFVQTDEIMRKLEELERTML